jgi:hypothetical protein
MSLNSLYVSGTFVDTLVNLDNVKTIDIDASGNAEVLFIDNQTRVTNTPYSDLMTAINTRYAPNI